MAATRQALCLRHHQLDDKESFFRGTLLCYRYTLVSARTLFVRNDPTSGRINLYEMTTSWILNLSECTSGVVRFTLACNAFA